MESEKTGHQHTPEEESRIREAALDKTIADSFPASDPPSSDPNPDDHSAIEREGPGDASSWSRAFRAMFEAELFARFTWVSIVRRTLAWTLRDHGVKCQCALKLSERTTRPLHRRGPMPNIDYSQRWRDTWPSYAAFA
jgi:hypothetical protein